MAEKILTRDKIKALDLKLYEPFVQGCFISISKDNSVVYIYESIYFVHHYDSAKIDNIYPVEMLNRNHYTVISHNPFVKGRQYLIQKPKNNFFRHFCKTGEVICELINGSDNQTKNHYSENRQVYKITKSQGKKNIFFIFACKDEKAVDIESMDIYEVLYKQGIEMSAKVILLNKI
jgi:uncharacterized protein YkuJ